MLPPPAPLGFCLPFGVSFGILTVTADTFHSFIVTDTSAIALISVVLAFVVSFDFVDLEDRSSGERGLGAICESGSTLVWQR